MPPSRIAIINSEVATGRSMNRREGLLRAAAGSALSRSGLSRFGSDSAAGFRGAAKGAFPSLLRPVTPAAALTLVLRLLLILGLAGRAWSRVAGTLPVLGFRSIRVGHLHACAIA